MFIYNLYLIINEFKYLFYTCEYFYKINFHFIFTTILKVMKTIIIFGHPNVEASQNNKKMLDLVKDKVTVHDISKL